MSVLSLDNICFSYGKKAVLKNLTYEFEKGKMYCIAGKSGAGKTTLLSVLSGLAAPTGGSIYYNGKDVKNIDRYKFRSKYIGVIFQSYNLITKFTAVENVMLSMDIAGVKKSGREAADPAGCAAHALLQRHIPLHGSAHKNRQKAMELLASVGLDEDEANRRVLKLSGGQQQRVAIARALSYDADIILADEPTGNLDSETQNEIIKLFRRLAEQGKCVILVSHSPEVASMCDERYELKRI